MIRVGRGGEPGYSRPKVRPLPSFYGGATGVLQIGKRFGQTCYLEKEKKFNNMVPWLCTLLNTSSIVCTASPLPFSSSQGWTSTLDPTISRTSYRFFHHETSAALKLTLHLKYIVNARWEALPASGFYHGNQTRMLFRTDILWGVHTNRHVSSSSTVPFMFVSGPLYGMPYHRDSMLFFSSSP